MCLYSIHVTAGRRQADVDPKLNRNEVLGNLYQMSITNRGGSRISGKGVHMYKSVGIRFAESHFILNIS